MATIPPPVRSTAKTRLRVFTRTQMTLLIVLVATFVLCIAFTWTTRDAMSNLPFLGQGNRGRAAFGGPKTIVDLTPWQTAEALAALAVSNEERQYAREAERLAYHEVDQAFASALRQASIKRPVLSSEAIAIQQQMVQLEQTVKADQAHVDSLTAALGKSNATKTDQDQDGSGSDELDLAKAQLTLDQNELSDAQENFARATGDQRGRIQQELTTHQAAMSKYEAAHDQGQTAVAVVAQHGTLAGRIRAWFAQLDRYQLLQQAI